MVAIAVVGILAGIVALSYSGWRTETMKTTMKNDLLSLASAMEDRRNFTNKYPTSFPSGFTPTTGNILQLVGVTDTYYCVDVYNTDAPSVVLSYDSVGRDAREYPCSGMPTGSPIGGSSTPSAPRGTNLAGDFTTWQLSGTASVSGGVLTLGSSGSAKSPAIRVTAPKTISVGGDLMASQQSPNASLQPNAGHHVSIYYYGSDGTTAATNSSGYTSNGCAKSFTKGSWQTAVSSCGFSGGPNVIYIRYVFWSSASGYSSPDLKVRNPLVKVVD